MYKSSYPFTTDSQSSSVDRLAARRTLCRRPKQIRQEYWLCLTFTRPGSKRHIHSGQRFGEAAPR